MESMCSLMTDKQAYSILLREIECRKNRDHCSRQCSSCSSRNTMLESLESFGYIQSILKARCPELYFADTLQEASTKIEEVLKENEDQNKET